MHYRMLVTFYKGEAIDSAEARSYVNAELVEDASFLGGGRFHPAYSDWFVIGGRWSGELSHATWAREVQEQIEALEKKEGIHVWGIYYGDQEARDRQAKLRQKVEAMYAEAIPEVYRDKGLVVTRNTYAELGYEDDAMIVTQELYDALLAEYAGEEIVFRRSVPAFVDFEFEALSPKFVGEKWLVVVDVHY